jgi:hypothetical protein
MTIAGAGLLACNRCSMAPAHGRQRRGIQRRGLVAAPGQRRGTPRCNAPVAHRARSARHAGWQRLAAPGRFRCN